MHRPLNNPNTTAAGIRNRTTLQAAGTITDTGHIGMLRSLETLDLSGSCRLTDAGLSGLARLRGQFEGIRYTVAEHIFNSTPMLLSPISPAYMHAHRIARGRTWVSPACLSSTPRAHLSMRAMAAFVGRHFVNRSNIGFLRVLGFHARRTPCYKRVP